MGKQLREQEWQVGVPFLATDRIPRRAIAALEATRFAGRTLEPVVHCWQAERGNALEQVPVGLESPLEDQKANSWDLAAPLGTGWGSLGLAEWRMVTQWPLAFARLETVVALGLPLERVTGQAAQVAAKEAIVRAPIGRDCVPWASAPPLPEDWPP